MHTAAVSCIKTLTADHTAAPEEASLQNDYRTWQHRSTLCKLFGNDGVCIGRAIVNVCDGDTIGK